MSVISHLVKSQRTEVTEKLRREVRRVVKGCVDQGVAEIVPGVVFIDEVRFVSDALLSLPIAG
jgi:RuvB-like protein 1 (pontin 52)